MDELSSVVVQVDPKAEGSSQPPAEEAQSSQDNNSNRENSSESSITEIGKYVLHYDVINERPPSRGALG